MGPHVYRSPVVGALLIVFGLSSGSSLGADPLHDPINTAYLQSLSDKKSLTADELARARDAMLKINNEARLNNDYRKQKKLKNDLELPTGLKPLVLSEMLNAAAQEQAEAAAGLIRIPRGKAIPGAMASGTAASLADFPIGWQASDSTYRPTWNLGGRPVDSVGYGMAKSAAGQWSVVAVWADLGGAAFENLGLHDLPNIKKLTSFSDKTRLTADELQSVRLSMLQLNNEARANPEYRKKMGSTKDLNLPSNLPPLVLDDAANKAAQVQADYQAGIGTMTHDNTNYRGYDDRMAKTNVPGALEACGFSSNLNDFPIGWMKGDTHYRPTWNIDIPVHRVGYGAAKDVRTGRWYCTALWLPATDAEKVAGAAAVQPPAAADVKRDYMPKTLKTIDGQTPKRVPDPGPGGSAEAPVITKGMILHWGDVLRSKNGNWGMIVDNQGSLIITDRSGKPKWTAGKGGSHAEYQATDGNFCFYDKKKNWIWGTQTHGDHMTDGKIRLTDDGVLQQLDKDGKVVWSSQ